jgi:hypothetical protein
MNLYKSTKLGVLILGALSVILYIWVSSTTESIIANNGSVPLTLFIFISYITMFLSVGFVLFFVFKAIASDKTKMKKALIYSGITLLVIIVTYFISDSTPYEKYNIGEGYSKLISTGLNLFYLTGLATIVTLIYTSVKKKNY